MSIPGRNTAKQTCGSRLGSAECGSRTEAMQKIEKKWLQNHPWIFLFQISFHYTVSYDMVWTKRSVCQASSVVLVV